MGKYNIEFGKVEIQQGVGNSNYEGGISSDSLCNLDYRKGVFAPPIALLDSLKDDDIADMRIVAYANNNAQATNAAMCVGEEDTSFDGQIYAMSSNGGGGVTASGAQDTGRDYKLGYTDAIFYNDKYYVTSTTDIAIMDADLGNKDFDWWTTVADGGQAALGTGVPHMMVEAKGFLYILDGNKVHRLDSSGTVINGILTLDDEFVCMTIEYHNNKLYIYADRIKDNMGNAGSTVAIVASPGELIMWDGTNIDTSTIERYKIASPIYTLKSFNGTLYAWDAYNFNYINGITVTPLRETNGYPKYKALITTFKDRLYWIDGSSGDGATSNDRVICFNGKQFYHCIGTVGLTGATYIDSIFHWKGDKLALCSNEDTYTLDFETTVWSGDAGYVAYSKWYELPAISKIERCLLELTEAMANNSSMTISAVDALGNTRTLLTISYTADGAIIAKEQQSLTDEFSSFRFKIAWAAVPKPIKRILLTLDSTANPL